MPTLEDLRKIQESKKDTETPVLDNVNIDEPSVNKVNDDATVNTDAAVENVVVENEEPKINQESIAPQEPIEGDVGNTPDTNQEVNKGDFANEELVEANAFIKRTGKTMADYLNLKKPIEEFPEDDLLRNYLTEKEGKTKSEAELEIRRLKAKDDDSEDLDEDLFTEEEIELKKLEIQAREEKRESLLNKAKQFREDQVKKELNANTDDSKPQEVFTQESFVNELKQSAEKANESFLTDVYTALPKLKTIPMNIEGKTVEFTLSEDLRNEIKTTTEDLMAVTQQYFDPSGNGKLANAIGLMTEVSARLNPKVFNAMQEFYANQIKNEVLSRTDTKERNVTLSQTNEMKNGNVLSNSELAAQRLREKRKSPFGL